MAVGLQKNEEYKMAKYIGPKNKLSRREGTDLLLKSGYRSYESKARSENPPGVHGARRVRLSDFGVQLREKQKVKRMYGVLEKQFRNYYKQAARKKGETGTNLLVSLESRLDNLVYRLGIAKSRSAARQLVSHCHITVDGKIVNIPSYVTKEGQVIGVREKSKSLKSIVDSVKNNSSSYEWLNWNGDKLEGKFLKIPNREEIPENIKEQLIVELYSK